MHHQQQPQQRYAHELEPQQAERRVSIVSGDRSSSSGSSSGSSSHTHRPCRASSRRTRGER